MEEKEVILFVRGEQSFDGLPADVTELMTEGLMTIDGGAITLTYQETELTGMEGTTTSFFIRGDCVELRRTGGINSQMLFQQGKRHSSLYETPWGALLVDVSTTSLSHRLGSRGGILDIRFNIAVDHQVTGENHFKIRVKDAARQERGRL